MSSSLRTAIGPTLRLSKALSEAILITQRWLRFTARPRKANGATARRFARAHKYRIEGNPDPKHVSTSFVERSNLSMRMGNRRMTRLTNAFSKKAENHAHMMAIYFMHYNFVRIHQTLKVTPAMAAGVTSKLWEMSDMVKVLEDWEISKGGGMNAAKIGARYKHHLLW